MTHGYAEAKTQYIKVLTALLALTALTIYVASFNFGEWNTIVALLIASCKASLVGLFFMHLKDDKPINWIIFLTAIFMLALFLIFILIDVDSRPAPRPADLRPARGGPGTSTLINAGKSFVPSATQPGEPAATEGH